MITARASAIVLWTSRFPAVVGFYRALGLALVDEQHDDGPLHAAADLGGVHVAIYPVSPTADHAGHTVAGHRAAGATLIGFDVDDVDARAAAAQAAGAVIERAPERVPWGRRAVLRDPDGRPVEINQATAPDAAP